MMRKRRRKLTRITMRKRQSNNRNCNELGVLFKLVNYNS